MPRRRLSVQVSDTLAQQLDAAATRQDMSVSDIMRQALELLFNAPKGEQRANTDIPQARPPHSLSDCAAAILKRCLPEVQERFQDIVERTGCTLADVIPVALRGWLQHIDTCPLTEADEPEAGD